MHILYLSAAGGGHETNVRVLAPALINKGHQVSILYLHPAAEAHTNDREQNGISVYHATYGDWHYYFNKATRGVTGLSLILRSIEASRALVRRVREIHRQNPIDLVELPEVILPGLSLPVPYVVRLHSQAWMWKKQCNEPNSASDSIEMRLEGNTLSRADAITAPSLKVADEIRSLCRLNGKAVQIIPYPVETDRFKPVPKDGSRKSVLFVGRVEKRKGADVLLRAIPQVLEKHPDCEFLFVGQVSDELSELVKAAPPAARFLPFKPRPELVALYQQASVCAIPSLWDNSPNVVYEAMACGAAVVATRVGGIPELIADGDTGLLVSPRDERALAAAIIRLLDDSNEREVLAAAGRQKALAEWPVERIATQTLDLYQRILKS